MIFTILLQCPRSPEGVSFIFFLAKSVNCWTFLHLGTRGWRCEGISCCWLSNNGSVRWAGGRFEILSTQWTRPVLCPVVRTWVHSRYQQQELDLCVSHSIAKRCRSGMAPFALFLERWCSDAARLLVEQDQVLQHCGAAAVSMTFFKYLLLSPWLWTAPWQHLCVLLTPGAALLESRTDDARRNPVKWAASWTTCVKIPSDRVFSVCLCVLRLALPLVLTPSIWTCLTSYRSTLLAK